MALTLDSIYKPLNDFFVKRFSTQTGSPVVFRFDKFGSVLTEEDFIDDNRPDLGYLPALAREKVSDLVNRVPVDLGDGVNVMLTAASIDDIYCFRLLKPSVPYAPAGTDDVTKQAIVEAFTSLKAEALKVWNDLKLESLSGVMLQYKPSTATPENWYDISKDQVWTRQTFEISEPSAPAGPAACTELWRLRPSDHAFTEILKLDVAPLTNVVVPDLGLAARAVELRTEPLSPVTSTDGLEREPGASSLERGQPANALSVTGRLSKDSVVPLAPLEPRLYDAFVGQTRFLDIRDRVVVNEAVAQSAPTQPAKTSKISVSFDYCVVSIRREWFMDAFVNQRSWWIPSLEKGEMTSSATPGALTLLPIGFVAIKKLTISANWPSEDLANASVATDFGPFKVAGDVVSGTLSCPGLQIVGWLLQTLPVLPPNGAPVASPAATPSASSAAGGV